jgi:polyferredoxin
MGRISFVAMLFVMALACIGIAISSSSWGWAIGGIVFLFVGNFARRQFNNERESGPETASNKFIIYAFLGLFVGFAIIVFLSHRLSLDRAMFNIQPSGQSGS